MARRRRKRLVKLKRTFPSKLLSESVSVSRASGVDTVAYRALYTREINPILKLFGYSITYAKHKTEARKAVEKRLIELTNGVQANQHVMLVKEKFINVVLFWSNSGFQGDFERPRLYWIIFHDLVKREVHKSCTFTSRDEAVEAYKSGRIIYISTTPVEPE